MSKLVVDSCVVIKWLVEESDTPAARQLLVASVSGGTELLAPNLIYAEISNILWKKVRRQLLTADEAGQAFDEFEQLPLTLVSSVELSGTALQVAFDCSQSPYDCLYVALSARESCPLVTTDAPLVRRVGRKFTQVYLLEADQ